MASAGGRCRGDRRRQRSLQPRHECAEQPTCGADPGQHAQQLFLVGHAKPAVGPNAAREPEPSQAHVRQIGFGSFLGIFACASPHGPHNARLLVACPYLLFAVPAPFFGQLEAPAAVQETVRCYARWRDGRRAILAVCADYCVSAPTSQVLGLLLGRPDVKLADLPESLRAGTAAEAHFGTNVERVKVAHGRLCAVQFDACRGLSDVDDPVPVHGGCG